MQAIQWRERVIEICDSDGVSIVDAIFHPDIAPVFRQRMAAKIGRACPAHDDDQAFFEAADREAHVMAREVVARKIANRAVAR